MFSNLLRVICFPRQYEQDITIKFGVIKLDNNKVRTERESLSFLRYVNDIYFYKSHINSYLKNIFK